MLSTSAVREAKVMDDCSPSSARMMVLLLGGDLGLFELVLQPGDKVWHKIYGFCSLYGVKKIIIWNWMQHWLPRFSYAACLNIDLVTCKYYSERNLLWRKQVHCELCLGMPQTFWTQFTLTVYKVKHCSKSKRSYHHQKKRGTHLNILWNTKTSGRRWYFI